MEALKAEIARKRKQIEDAKVVEEGKKYFKRGDLIAKHEEEYLKKYAPQGLLPMKISPIKRGEEDEDKSRELEARNMEELPKLSKRETIRRLRERGEPIMLFGETDNEIFKRLRKLEILEPEVNRGFRNDLQAALDRVDQVYLEEILKTTRGDMGEKDKVKMGDVKVIEDDYTYDDIVTKAKEIFKNSQDKDSHAKMILHWCKFLLKIWGKNLNSRPQDEKLGTRGKLSSASYNQTVEYLKPLLRKLKTKTLADDIQDCLVEIVLFMLDKEYIKANDAYLEMAIGNAPWPIGVTMVGIHARTGREKIFSRNVAHVMNDEMQRKYIQALKRLITKCQQFFPTVPSKSVEYLAAPPV